MMWRWLPGRQGTGYRKLLLVHGENLDIHVLDYPHLSHVPVHMDPIPGRRHIRANLLLTGARKLYVDDAIFECGRLAIFRSDRLHMVGLVTQGRSLVLSLGLSLPA